LMVNIHPLQNHREEKDHIKLHKRIVIKR